MLLVWASHCLFVSGILHVGSSLGSSGVIPDVPVTIRLSSGTSRREGIEGRGGIIVEGVGIGMEGEEGEGERMLLVVSGNEPMRASSSSLSSLEGMSCIATLLNGKVDSSNWTSLEMTIF